MSTSGQICKMSYTAYCNTYCNMGQPYCNIPQYALPYCFTSNICSIPDFLKELWKLERDQCERNINNC